MLTFDPEITTGPGDCDDCTNFWTSIGGLSKQMHQLQVIVTQPGKQNDPKVTGLLAIMQKLVENGCELVRSMQVKYSCT